MTYLIGIVTFNPDLSRLRENLNAAFTNIDVLRIILVDNGSENIADIDVMMREYSNLYIIKLGENKGIAAALNIIGKEAEKLCCDWFMTLDQDSVLQPRIIETMSKNTVMKDVGIISPRIEDRNYGCLYSKRNSGVDRIEKCITSGNLVRTKVWKECGGYDENMIIDGVDFDFCLSVQEIGSKILRVNDVFLTQEIGHGYAIRFYKKMMLILNHSPLRLYYISRNYLYVGKKHHQQLKWTEVVMKRILIVILFEKDKITKIRFILRGIKDFVNKKMGQYSNI